MQAQPGIWSEDSGELVDQVARHLTLACGFTFVEKRGQAGCEHLVFGHQPVAHAEGSVEHRSDATTGTPATAIAVPIHAADDISAEWIQHTFSRIHGPPCPRAMDTDGMASVRGEGGDAAGTMHEDSAEEAASRGGAVAKQCAGCPSPLQEIHLAVVDSDGSVLVYRMRNGLAR